MKSQYLFPILIMSFMLLASCSKDNDEIDYFEYNEPGKAFIHGGEIVDANTDVDMSVLMEDLQGRGLSIDIYDSFKYGRTWVQNHIEEGTFGYSNPYNDIFIFRIDGSIYYFPEEIALHHAWNPTPDVFNDGPYLIPMTIDVDNAKRTIKLSYKFTEDDYKILTWKVISYDLGRLIVDETEVYSSSISAGINKYDTTNSDSRKRRIVKVSVNKSTKLDEIKSITQAKEDWSDFMKKYYPDLYEKYKDDGCWKPFGL